MPCFSERFDYIVSIFSEGSLRHFSDFLDADISMMAIHSAKGLEWDIVFIPAVTRFDWPEVICSLCQSAGTCSRSAHGWRIVDSKKIPNGLIEEMGLPYVGVTRARRAVYVSASMRRRTKYGNYQVACPSCLTSLPRALSLWVGRSWTGRGDLWRYGACLLLARGLVPALAVVS